MSSEPINVTFGPIRSITFDVHGPGFQHLCEPILKSLLYDPAQLRWGGGKEQGGRKATDAVEASDLEGGGHRLPLPTAAARGGRGCSYIWPPRQALWIGAVEVMSSSWIRRWFIWNYHGCTKST